MKLKSEIWIFDCPWHGKESSVLCFRAFDNQNTKRWHKYKVSYQEIPVDEDEIEQHLEEIVSQQMPKISRHIEWPEK